MDGGRYDGESLLIFKMLPNTDDDVLVIEFKNRYITLPALDDDCIQPESLLSRSALQINATTKCISAAHMMLDLFISVPVDEIRKSPNALYVRAVYSLVTLMKADYAVGTDAEMGELLESQNLKVGYYLDIVLRKTSEAAGPQKCRNPSHWNFLLEAKLKSWWDEYQEWRKEGRHLKRRKTQPSEEIGTTTGNQTPAFADPNPQPAASAVNPSHVAAQHQQPAPLPVPNFSMANAYATNTPWNTSDMALDAATSAQGIGDQTTFTPDMGDFSAAFQNGDLYLWNDLSADNFGDWVPQGGPYSGMSFGGMNGPGF